jgi:hypothetical protein
LDVQYYVALVKNPRRAVLLVDDDLAIREALTEALAEEGFPVHAAQNGLEAPKGGLVEGSDAGAVSLGAAKVRLHDAQDDWFCVMHDPEGNEFCICLESAPG